MGAVTFLWRHYFGRWAVTAAFGGEGAFVKGIILDLEMNQPSGRIIQIGAVLCDYRRRLILDTFNIYCRLPEPLDPFVAGLCGVSEELLEARGVDLASAAAAFWAWAESSRCGLRVGAWGSDLWELKRQSGELGLAVPTGLRSLNVKEMGSFWRLARGGKTRGGLVNTMELFGLAFDGRQHCALDDARNTARLVFVWCGMKEAYMKLERAVLAEKKRAEG